MTPPDTSPTDRLFVVRAPFGTFNVRCNRCARAGERPVGRMSIVEQMVVVELLKHPHAHATEKGDENKLLARRCVVALIDCWHQFAIVRPDGSRWPGGLSVLEEVQDLLTDNGVLDERGNLVGVVR